MSRGFRAFGVAPVPGSIAARIRDDIDAGLLGADVDADGLAAFHTAVIQGMNQQACDGATRQTLERVVDAAMAAWPGAPHRSDST
ncbi:hypothetical protein [Streptomyces coeruleofuscus]|uniref:TetR family transcriptional regulator n=1 Tax=Streptomyces coeruleofuscus TaxID=66879 RepID=A0ABP5UGJ8_9ACTN